MFDYNKTTALFYLFSSISQVLAAFIGLGSVYLIFKAQDIRKLQQKILSRIFNEITNGLMKPQIKSKELTQTIRDLINDIDNEIDINLNSLKYVTFHEESLSQMKSLSVYYKQYQRIQSIKISLYKYGKLSSIIGVITISYSLVMLVLSPLIDNDLLFYSLVIIPIISATISMGLMLFIIINSLKDFNPFSTRI